MDQSTEEKSVSKREITLFGMSLESLSKGVATFLVIVYVAGFLLLAIYFAQFGFAQVNPLKPRILEAGSIFILFTALPVLVAAVILALPERGLRASRLFTLRILFIAPMSAVLMHIHILMDGYSTSNGLFVWSARKFFALIIGFIAVLIGTWALMLFLAWFWKFYHLKYWVAVLLLAVLSIGAIYLNLWEYHSVRAHYFLWFIGVEFLAVIVGGKPPAKFRSFIHTNLEELHVPLFRAAPLFLFLNGLTLLVAYSALVFPQIPYSLGGGGLQRIKLFLVGYKKPFRDSLPTVQLLDETEQGYYVLFDGTDRATFIPRDRIKGLFFSDKSVNALDILPDPN